jgi:hypothetical protein
MPLVRSFLSFLYGLPAALLLTGVLIEKFQIIKLLEALALRFREVSAEIWRVLFLLLDFKFDYDPDVLSTYTLLLGPLVVKAVVGIVKFGTADAGDGAPSEDNAGQATESARSKRAGSWLYWYVAGLLSIAVVITGYGTWGYIADVFENVWILWYSAYYFGLIYLGLILTFALLLLPVMRGDAILAAFLLGGIVSSGLIVTWAVASLFGFSLISRLEAGALGENWFADTMLSYARLVSLDGLRTVYFGLATLLLLVLGPISRAPVYVVAWVGMFYVADWYGQDVHPAIESWLDELGTPARQ